MCVVYRAVLGIDKGEAELYRRVKYLELPYPPMVRDGAMTGAILGCLQGHASAFGVLPRI